MKSKTVSQYKQTIYLADVLDAPTKSERSWFWDFLSDIFSSPDLDYSQFEHLENRRTRAQMERERFY